MNARSFPRRLASAATTTVLSLGLLAGCAGEDDPLAPLYETLSQIDDSIVDGEYDRARDQVADLLDQVSQARTDGDMTKAAATRIREAAKALRSELADAEKEDAEEPTDTPTTPDSSGNDEQPSDEPSDEPTEEPTDEPSDEPTTSEPTTPKPTPTPAEPTPDEPTTEPPASDSGGDGDTSGTSGASGATGSAGSGDVAAAGQG